MKNIKLLFLAVIAIASFSSCNEDDEFYNSKYISIPGLINIETQPDYQVGDVLWVNTDFSRYLSEPEIASPLDIYRTTDGASFSFAYGLEKKNADNTWTIVDLENKMLSDEGNVFDGSYNVAECIYDGASETYRFRAGMPLQQAGTYRIFFGFTAISALEISSNNDSDKSTYLSIKTTANNLTDGYYNFTVE